MLIKQSKIMKSTEQGQIHLIKQAIGIGALEDI